MKAVNNNGIITTYPDVPKQFRSSTGYHLNARNMTADELRNAVCSMLLYQKNMIQGFMT